MTDWQKQAKEQQQRRTGVKPSDHTVWIVPVDASQSSIDSILGRAIRGDKIQVGPGEEMLVRQRVDARHRHKHLIIKVTKPKKR